MDDCRRTAERLTPYVDEALPPNERSDVERHLDDCPPCRRTAAEEQGGRRLVKECADRLRQSPLPPGLRSRCEALAMEHCRHSARAPWRARLLPATLIAAAVTLASVGVLSVVSRRSSTVLAAQLTADHVKCFKMITAGAAPAVVEAQHVERDLETRYGWDMHIPASSPADGLSLLGGARCLYSDGTLPHIMYRAAGATPVSLFRLEGVTRGEADVTTMGHRCRIWSRGGHTYVLVTPESSSSEDARVARYVRQEAR